MCFRPSIAKKREIACPKCTKMNPLPLSIESTLKDIMANENGKAILEKHCSVMTSDPRFQKAMGMTLKQVKPMSMGKLTSEMIHLVEQELAQLPVTNVCMFCGTEITLNPGPGVAGPAAQGGPVKS